MFYKGAANPVPIAAAQAQDAARTRSEPLLAPPQVNNPLPLSRTDTEPVPVRVGSATDASVSNASRDASNVGQERVVQEPIDQGRVVPNIVSAVTVPDAPNVALERVNPIATNITRAALDAADGRDPLALEAPNHPAVNSADDAAAGAGNMTVNATTATHIGPDVAMNDTADPQTTTAAATGAVVTTPVPAGAAAGGNTPPGQDKSESLPPSSEEESPSFPCRLRSSSFGELAVPLPGDLTLSLALAAAHKMQADERNQDKRVEEMRRAKADLNGQPSKIVPRTPNDMDRAWEETTRVDGETPENSSPLAVEATLNEPRTPSPPSKQMLADHGSIGNTPRPNGPDERAERRARRAMQNDALTEPCTPCPTSKKRLADHGDTSRPDEPEERGDRRVRRAVENEALQSPISLKVKGKGKEKEKPRVEKKQGKGPAAKTKAT